VEDVQSESRGKSLELLPGRPSDLDAQGPFRHL
jgi:hypothetical protein